MHRKGTEHCMSNHFPQIKEVREMSSPKWPFSTCKIFPSAWISSKDVKNRVFENNNNNNKKNSGLNPDIFFFSNYRKSLI